jgi:hypothetical protein
MKTYLPTIAHGTRLQQVFVNLLGECNRRQSPNSVIEVLKPNSNKSSRKPNCGDSRKRQQNARESNLDHGRREDAGRIFETNSLQQNVEAPFQFGCSKDYRPTAGI